MEWTVDINQGSSIVKVSSNSESVSVIFLNWRSQFHRAKIPLTAACIEFICTLNVKTVLKTSDFIARTENVKKPIGKEWKGRAAEDMNKHAIPHTTTTSTNGFNENVKKPIGKEWKGRAAEDMNKHAIPHTTTTSTSTGDMMQTVNGEQKRDIVNESVLLSLFDEDVEGPSSKKPRTEDIPYSFFTQQY
jgi:hypothetical protein